MQSPVTLPELEGFSGDIYFRHGDLGPEVRAAHSHPWGQFNYVSAGVMQLETAGLRFLSPPQYAVWVPPGFRHAASNQTKATYRTVYLSTEHSRGLPDYPCSLTVSPLLKALLNEFADLDVREPETANEHHMAQVVIYQITTAPILRTYLPFAASRSLQDVLDRISARPDDVRTISEIAAEGGMTARTFDRHCRTELGMSFGEWRQRMRFMKAVEALQRGDTIQRIAFDLGYATPSAFITMFRRLCGCTPEQYRRQL